MTDPEHVCQLVYDDDGYVIARSLGAAAMSEEAKTAMVALIAAARREFAVRCEQDPTILERQAAARARNRARLERLGLTGDR